MIFDTQMIFIALVLPGLFGLTFVGEGVWEMHHFESGWFHIVLGTLFLAAVAFGYFYLTGMRQ